MCRHRPFLFYAESVGDISDRKAFFVDVSVGLCRSVFAEQKPFPVFSRRDAGVFAECLCEPQLVSVADSGGDLLYQHIRRFLHQGNCVVHFCPALEFGRSAAVDGGEFTAELFLGDIQLFRNFSGSQGLVDVGADIDGAGTDRAAVGGCVGIFREPYHKEPRKRVQLCVPRGRVTVEGLRDRLGKLLYPSVLAAVDDFRYRHRQLRKNRCFHVGRQEYRNGFACPGDASGTESDSENVVLAEADPSSAAYNFRAAAGTEYHGDTGAVYLLRNRSGGGKQDVPFLRRVEVKHFFAPFRGMPYLRNTEMTLTILYRYLTIMSMYTV